MTDAEIDDLMRRLARPQGPIDPALLERIVGSIQATVTPVKPPWPLWARAGLVFAVCVFTAVVGAAWVGLDGIAVLAPRQRLLDLCSLGAILVVLARECVVRWTPGLRPWLTSGVAVSLSWMALLLVFALLFRDYGAEHFVSGGLGCLEQGVLHAIPAAILGALVLRRGFATRPVAAALVAGALAGLAGVAFLELHCSNIEAPHRLVWHAAVVPLSAGLGALSAWILGRAQAAIRTGAH